MEINRDEIRQLIDSLQEIQKALKDATPRTNTSQANFTISAGGAGIWIATTACLVMLGMMLIGGMWLATFSQRANAELAELRENDESQADYLSAVFQQVPEIKKQVDADRKAEEKP